MLLIRQLEYHAHAYSKYIQKAEENKVYFQQIDKH